MAHVISDRPPEHIDAGNCSIRRYVIADAPRLVDAVTSSIEHLKPWMGWIDEEPVDVSQREVHIATWNAKWDAGEDFMMGIFLDDIQVGGTGFHLRGAVDSLEIGYWVRTGYTGKGIATAVTGALTTVAFEMDTIRTVEIHHDVENIISGLIPQRLGFEKYWTGESVIEAPSESGVRNKWRMQQADWLAT